MRSTTSVKLPNKTLPWPILWQGVELIATSESCSLEAYLDIVGVPTIGWGEAQGISLGMVWTQEEADQKFCARLTEFADAVLDVCTVQPNVNELAAMVSLAYNIGINAFKKSSVLKAHNRGDAEAAARAFSLWNKAGGKVVSGLSLRRAREAALYLSPVGATEGGVPQRVDPEKPMTKSTLVQSGAITAGTGLLATLSSVSNDLRNFAENMGLNPLTIVGVIGLVVGGFIMYQRYKQRAEGRA